MSAQYGAALPHRPAPTGEQRWLPAASTLVVVGQARCSSHRTRDHRWPCVQFNCSSKWNSLSSAVQPSESLDIFRRRLKTELFERSYNWHRACQTTLLLRDSLSLSRSFLLWLQPWSLSTIMLLWHSFLIIIIIIMSEVVWCVVVLWCENGIHVRHPAHVFQTSNWDREPHQAAWWIHHHITSHGENGSRPQRPLYPRNIIIL